MDGGKLVLQLPPVGNPELATLPGMAATAPRTPPDGAVGISPAIMPDTSQAVPVALVQPARWTYDLDPANGVSRAAYTGEVFVAGNPITATPGVTTWNNRSGAVALTLADVTAVGAVASTNYLDNTGFSVNQRAYVSGTALAAGAFGHDRWKGGAAGGTYTFAQNAGPATLITITAGTLQQVAEGAALVSGNYVLSWSGTAQGRVGGGAYAASPVAVAGIVAGANTTIEFNTGTLGTVKFEAGTVATPWAAIGIADAWANCQRYYQTGPCGFGGYAVAGNNPYAVQPLAPAMRSTPAVTSNFTTQTNCGTSTFVAITGGKAVQASTIVTAIGYYSLVGTFTASADL